MRADSPILGTVETYAGGGGREKERDGDGRGEIANAPFFFSPLGRGPRLYTSLPGKILMPCLPDRCHESIVDDGLSSRAPPSMELEAMHVLGEAAKFSVKGTNAIAINIAAYIISPPPLSNTDSWHSCALLRFQRVSFFFSLSSFRDGYISFYVERHSIKTKAWNRFCAV